MLKPLGHKAYTSIGHLPGSRTGAADRHIPQGQADLCLKTIPGQHQVIVQEKLDGSCVSVAKHEGKIIALGRAGDLTQHARSPIRRLWHKWVEHHAARFDHALQEGERFVGEWLPICHGTRYNLPHEPFVVFDWFASGLERGTFEALTHRAQRAQLVLPNIIHQGTGLDIEPAMVILQNATHAIDQAEGAVWRVEGAGKKGPGVKIVAKYVRQDKVDGCYLPEQTGLDFQWNTFPNDAYWRSLF